MKKFLDGFNKIKQHFEKFETVEKKSGLEFLIKMMIEKEKYILNSEEKLDYYYNTNEVSEIDNNNQILFVAVVSFHHKKGSIVEYLHPTKEEILKTNYFFFEKYFIENKREGNNNINKELDDMLENILNQLTYLCLPDAIHTTNEDAQFFFIQNYNRILYGTSCYKQMKTKLTDLDDQNTRDYVQKILEQLYANYENISFKNTNLNELYMIFSLRKLIIFCKEKKSLKMYGLPLNVFNKKSKLFPIFTLYDFAEIENENSFLIGTTTQLVLTHKKIKYDAIINIDTEKITINEKLDKATIKISKEEKSIFTKIYDKIKDNFVNENENWMTNFGNYAQEFDSSDDYIRNEFKSYFYKFFIEVSLARQIADQSNNHEEMENNSNEKESKKEDTKISSKDKDKHKSHKLLRLEHLDKELLDEIIEPGMSNIMLDNSDAQAVIGRKISSPENKLSKLKKKNEKIVQKSVKSIVEIYNIDFICAWMETYNYKCWLRDHDSSICLRSKFIKNVISCNIIYENGDSYLGGLSKGKRNGYGVFTDLSNGFTYNGNWENDMKSGAGTLSSPDNKYIYDGEWKANKREGQGQLIDHKTKYSGQFKADFYHGSGVLCDNSGNIFDGDWKNGNFDGMGHLRYIDGGNYIGHFKDNLFHGNGQKTDADGTVYNGLFFNGKKSGEGLSLNIDGTKYEGVFQNDLFFGDGVFTDTNGKESRGVWIDGKLIDEEITEII